jgi:hypothetical protein
MYCYLKCIVYGKLLKTRQLFLITLHYSPIRTYKNTDAVKPTEKLYIPLPFDGLTQRSVIWC